MKQITAAYTRTSSPKKTRRQHHGSQLTMIKQWSKTNRTKLTYYKDYGSGKSADRPDLKRLLADIEEGKIKTLIVYRINRLSRSVKDLVNILQVLIDNKVELISLADSFQLQPGSAYSTFTYHLLSILGELSSSVLSENIKAGLRNRREKGFALGRAKNEKLRDLVWSWHERGYGPVDIVKKIRRKNLSANYVAVIVSRMKKEMAA